MAVYVVAQGNIEDPEKLNEYLQKAGPTIPPEARVLAADTSAEVVEGGIPSPRVVLIEFPSKEAFRAWYDSADYRAIVHLRLESAPGSLVVAEGV